MLLWAARPRSTCNRTLEYSLGSVDPRFNISEDDVLAAARQAAAIWNEAVGREVFRHNPSAPFRINLIYDERQRAVNEMKKRNSNLEFENADFNDLDDFYQKKRKSFETEKTSYEEKVSNLKASRKPVPRSVTAVMEKELLHLNSIASELNHLADRLGPKAAALRAGVEKYNELAGKVFDRGEFVGTRIDVYQFDDRKDLALIFAHEFGHALLIPHVEDPKAIMYYLRNGENSGSLRLTDADKTALTQACSETFSMDPRTFLRWRDRLFSSL